MKNKIFACLILSLVFFGAYSWFGAATPNIYNSPDETANYFFISQFVKHGNFVSPEPLNAVLDNMAHPRSISYNGFSLVPQGFIGLPLFYGLLAKIFGLFLARFFTPLLAVLGALAFYGLLERVFNRKIAFLSMFFLLIFPAYWYYASRAFYPNVPALALFLIALWAFGGLYKNGKWREAAIFSASLAVAVAIRPIEAIWMLPIIIAAAVISRKKISPVKVIAALLIMLAFSVPVLFNNNALYGSPFGAGYILTRAVGNDGGAIAAAANGAPGPLFPFGFHPLQILKNIYKILIKYFWWFSIPALFGLILFLFGKMDKGKKMYLASAAFVFSWLAFYYGSGVFSDNPSGFLTIGDSHFRYWLPVFAAMAPLVSLFWIKLSEKLKLEKALLPSALVFSAVLSLYAVYWSADDGLLAVKNTLASNYAVKLATEKILPPDAVIITGRQDKIFFPEIKVLYVEGLDNALALNILKAPNPFYYYTVGLNAEELVNINNMLKIHGLRLQRIEIFGKEVLYKLEEINHAAA